MLEKVVHKSIGYWEGPRERYIPDGYLCGGPGVYGTEVDNEVTCPECLKCLKEQVDGSLTTLSRRRHAP